MLIPPADTGTSVICDFLGQRDGHFAGDDNAYLAVLGTEIAKSCQQVLRSGPIIPIVTGLVDDSVEFEGVGDNAS